MANTDNENADTAASTSIHHHSGTSHRHAEGDVLHDHPSGANCLRDECAEFPTHNPHRAHPEATSKPPIPSLGACIESLHLVLEKTDGVLDPELRRHLQGVALFLHEQENEEVRRYTERFTGAASGG